MDGVLGTGWEYRREAVYVEPHASLFYFDGTTDDFSETGADSVDLIAASDDRTRAPVRVRAVVRAPSVSWRLRR